jgi:hypothetical protein
MKIKENERAAHRTEVPWKSFCFHASLFLGLFFDPEDGSVMFLRNVG